MGELATIVAIIILWGVVSKPLDRRGITSAIFFAVAGFLVGAKVLGILDVPAESEAAAAGHRGRARPAALQRRDAAGPAGAAPRARLAEPPAPHRAAPDAARRDGRRHARVPRHGAGLGVPALDDALPDRRSARPEGLLRHLGAGSRTSGARRGGRAQRRHRRALLPRGARPRQRRAHDGGHLGGRQERGRAARLGTRRRPRRGPGRRAALPRRRSARLDQRRVAADHPAGHRAARLRPGRDARRQRLHRRLRRRLGLRRRVRAARLRDHGVHGRDRRPARRLHLDRLRRAGAGPGRSRTSPGGSSSTRCSA